jgi:hypothetical protein
MSRPKPGPGENQHRDRRVGGRWGWICRLRLDSRVGQRQSASTGVSWCREGMGLPAPDGFSGRAEANPASTGGELVGARVDLPAPGGSGLSKPLRNGGPRHVFGLSPAWRLPRQKGVVGHAPTVRARRDALERAREAERPPTSPVDARFRPARRAGAGSPSRKSGEAGCVLHTVF